VTAVARWSRVGEQLPVGMGTGVAGHGVTDLVRRTARPARIDNHDAAADSSAEDGVLASVGAPIIVDGALWGVMIASTRAEEPLPVETESRIADFTQLAATAVSNTQAWTETRRLAGEQSSLRRVATLVAREAPPPEVFAAVAEEVARLFGVDGARMWGFETEGEATVLAARGELDIPARTGTRVTPEPHSISARVRRTGAPARVVYDDPSDPRTADARASGVQAAVGAPIVVDGRLWGAMVVATTRQEDLPADTEARVAEFTELIAMAISNLQARSELAASRARIVAATDEERRRVVRDLHDGAQQRLVQTVLTLKLADRELAEASDQGAGARRRSARAGRAGDGRATRARPRHPSRRADEGWAARQRRRADLADADAGREPRRSRPPTRADRGHRVLRRRRGADERDQARARDLGGGHGLRRE
jgi:transcriptional regulator with GAF, ATPase, and Fis domain